MAYCEVHTHNVPLVALKKAHTCHGSHGLRFQCFQKNDDIHCVGGFNNVLYEEMNDSYFTRFRELADFEHK